VAREQASRAKFPLYHSPAHFVKQKIKKFCTNFYPKICAICIAIILKIFLDFSIVIVYNLIKENKERKEVMTYGKRKDFSF
jgi:hypothetical protein